MGLGVTLFSVPLSLVGQISNPKNPFAESKVRINFSNLNTFASFTSINQISKVQVNAFTVSGKASGIQLPAGTELVAIMDSQCMASSGGKTLGEFSRRVRKFENATTSLIYAEKVNLDTPITLEQLSASAEVDACVVGLVDNIRFTKSAFNEDPLFAIQSHLPAISTSASNDLFWDSSFAITKDVIVAIIDTGVDYLHPDLQNRMWQNNQGQFGFDFVSNDTNPLDDNGHGTHVAGLAAAQSGNNIGISGVLGYHGKIMAIKALDAEGGGDLDAVINGINFAVDNGADVINMSLGGAGANAGIQMALDRAVSNGVVVLAAAGNESTQLSNVNFFSPGSYAAGISGVVAVGSFDVVNFARSGFSNFSPQFVELAAPGSSGNDGIVSTYINNQYAGLEGTSMATPIVSGAAGLVIGFLKSNNIVYTPEVVESILLGGSIQDVGLMNSFKDGNRLDLNRLGRYLTSRYIFSGKSGMEDSL